MIHFNEKELAVLSVLYRQGETTVSALAKETLINRTTLYPIVEKLVKQGIVSHVKMGGLTYLRAIPREDLSAWIEQQKGESEKKLDQLTAWLKQQTRQTSPSLVSEVTYFEGVEGVKKMFADSWRNNSEKMICGLVDYDKAVTTLGDYFLKEYVPQRKKHGVFFQGIIPSSRLVKKRSIESREARDLRQLESLGSLGIEIDIYDSKMAIFDYDEKKPSGIIIKNDKIALAMKKIFQFLWAKSAPLK